MSEEKGKRSTRALGTLALVVIIGAAGYYYYTTLQAPAPPAKEAIMVGLSASLTGRYELLGKQGLNGLQMWAEGVNDQGGIFVKELGRKLPVKVIYYDDRSDKDTALRLTEKLIVEDKVDFVFAPYSSELAFAAAPISEKYHKLSFPWGASSDEIWAQGYKYVVGVYTPTSGTHISALDLFAQKYPKGRVALVTQEDIASVAAERGAEARAKALGLQVFKDRYPTVPTDLSPILLKIKELKPDGVFVSGHLPDNVLFLKQMAELRVDVKFLSIFSGAAASSFGQQIGGVAEYIFAPSEWEAVDIDPGKITNWAGSKVPPKEWAAQFRARYGYAPDYRAAGSYGAAVILQTAIERAGSLDNDKMREALAGMDVTTLFGRFKVDPATMIQVGHEMVLSQWLQSKKVVVYPPQFAEGQPVIPAPTWEARGK